MEENKINKNCWGPQVNSTSLVEENKLCPVCNEEGIQVRGITVKHMVIENLIPQVRDDNYYLCINEKCNIAYYSSNPDFHIKKEQIKVPIWFKEDANPKYICYCNKVTEEQIINAVRNEGAKSMKDIIKLTSAMKNGKCEINHPTGKCCSSVIQETINRALGI